MPDLNTIDDIFLFFILFRSDFYEKRTVSSFLDLEDAPLRFLLAIYAKG